MGRVRSLIAAASILAFGPGCAGSKFWKSDEPEQMPVGVPSAPLSSTLRPAVGGNIVQASATEKAPTSTSFSPFGKPTPVTEKKVTAAEITILWRNKIDFLPDPARNGEMGPGLVGQLFLLGARDQFAPVDGKLVVALYDETPRPPGVPQNKPEGWEFTKEALKGLITPDERFGMCYAFFLPWPTYRADVTRIRVAARYEPENGHPLYAQETKITLDNRTPGNSDASGGWTTQQIVPGQQSSGFTALGGPPPASGTSPGMGMVQTGPSAMAGNNMPPQNAVVPSAGPAMPLSPSAPPGQLPPAPGNFGAVSPVGPGVPGAAGVPINMTNLPPIAFTAPRPQ